MKSVWNGVLKNENLVWKSCSLVGYLGQQLHSGVSINSTDYKLTNCLARKTAAYLLLRKLWLGVWIKLMDTWLAFEMATRPHTAHTSVWLSGAHSSQVLQDSRSARSYQWNILPYVSTASLSTTAACRQPKTVTHCTSDLQHGLAPFLNVCARASLCMFVGVRVCVTERNENEREFSAVSHAAVVRENKSKQMNTYTTSGKRVGTRATSLSHSAYFSFKKCGKTLTTKRMCRLIVLISMMYDP